MKVNAKALRRQAAAGIAVIALALAGCGGNEGDKGGAAGEYANLSGELKASGASFPDAYYQEVIGAFKEAAPNVTVTYNSTGSGTGKSEFGEGLTDFAGTDSLVKDDDGIKEEFLYVPTVAAPITVTYNLEGVDKLQLSADTVAKIFQGDIKTWNDPAVVADNPDAKLPSTKITIAHRSDGSGTTKNFTKYLEKASKAWKLGSGDTVEWPKDSQGGAKNTGVAQIVKSTAGAIGYVDLSDAKASGLTFAAIKNKDGNYVVPSLEGTTAGLEGAEIAEDLSYNPLDAAGAEAYPITAPTFILVKAKYDDKKKAELVKAFLTFLLNDGQEFASDVDFAPLPDELKKKALAQLDKIES
ncbi:MAG: phosphate ABC transporter substrate-binding protein PstS [Micromonosporaceae bacterium]